jgi:ketosteroid isomerase-like protein
MSQESVEVVRRIFEAFSRGDFEGGIELADTPPGFEFVPSGGVETSWDPLSVWTVRDGRLVRWLGFTDRDAALKAAGLSE